MTARALSFTLSCLSLSFLCFFSSCSTSPQSQTASDYENYDVPAKQGNNPKAIAVKISLSNQALYVVESGKVLLATAICSGGSKTPTPKGNFSIKKLSHYKRANTHGWAYNPSSGQYKRVDRSKTPKGWKYLAGTPMAYWSEFISPSYGIHTGYVHPVPCSHGCVRIHHNVMPKVFRYLSPGTPVYIAQEQPEDYNEGLYLKRPPSPKSLAENPTLEVSDAVFTYHKTVNFD